MKLSSLKQLEKAHDDGVWAAAWAPATEASPQLLLTGSVDETVKIWRGDELEPVRTNTGHALGACCIVIVKGVGPVLHC